MDRSLPINALDALQDRFAIIDLSGEIRLIDRHQIASLLSGEITGNAAMYKKADAELIMKRYLETLPIACKPKQVVIDFWTSPKTKEYKATAFTPKPTPTTTLNFWVGPTAAPHAGNWLVLRNYLRDVICAGNDSNFEYLIHFMSHMIQKPEEKPGIMIVLLGGQGTGKGVYFSLLRAIWSRTTLQVADIDQVIGKFNALLEQNYVVCMDEALFSGDRKSMDRLKSTVTESVIQIEQKYQPSRVIDSVHRFFAASNHEHFGNVERDDRRFIFFRVSHQYQQNTTYFREITNAISNPEIIGALIYYLLKKDISNFEVRIKPKSPEHMAQKLLSLNGFDRYWYEVLVTGILNGGKSGPWETKVEWSGPLFVSTIDLVSNYKAFNKNAQRHQTVQNNQIAESLRRLCPSADSDRQVLKDSSIGSKIRPRGFQLPHIDTARQEFAKVMGGKIEWD